MPAAAAAATDDNSDSLSVELSGDDESIQVVDFELELTQHRYSTMVYGASMPNMAGRNPGGAPNRRGTERSAVAIETKKRPAFHRKDKVLFLGVPPPVPPSSPADPASPPGYNPKSFLILANLHWMLSEAEIWDGACTYGGPRGIHIFETPGRKRSDGVALLEFATPQAVVSAKQDAGRAWSNKQANKPVQLFSVTREVVAALAALPHPNDDPSMQHWTRATYITQQLIDAVYTIIQRASPPAFYEYESMGLPRPVAQPKAAATVERCRLPLPSAVAVLVEQIRKQQP